MDEGAQKQEIHNEKVVRSLQGKNFSLLRENNLQRLQSKQEVSTEVDWMKQQQSLKVIKDMTKKIRSKERRDAESRWWVSVLLAADCEKAWIHTGWEDTLQKWFQWWEMKKNDEKVKMEEMHQHKVAQLIKSAEGSESLLHKIPKPTAWRTKLTFW